MAAHRQGTIVVINGASSSGKSSTVRAFQARARTPFLDAGLDRFLFMLPARYRERPDWDDVLGRNIRAGRVGHQTIAAMHAAIAAISDTGMSVVADHVLVERAWVDDLVARFAARRAYLIGLRPPVATLIERERMRRDRTLGQAAEQAEPVHRYVDYDLVLDTSVMSPDQCAARIAARLRRPPAALSTLATAAAGGASVTP
jgi:chloramphenicol 3-O phosphotransferase